MKVLSRNEMKNLKGGALAEDGGANCIASHADCPLSQAACGSRNAYKACSTGTGSFAWKCC